MGLHLKGMHLKGMHLMGHASHGHASYRPASHELVSYRPASHGRGFHKYVPYPLHGQHLVQPRRSLDGKAPYPGA